MKGNRGHQLIELACVEQLLLGHDAPWLIEPIGVRLGKALRARDKTMSVNLMGHPPSAQGWRTEQVTL